MPSLQAFLDGLALKAGRTLSPEEASAFVGEAREHLEESIQARLELGLDVEAAEREAIAAFGAVRAVARSIATHSVPEDRRLRWLAFGFVGLAFQYVSIRWATVGRVELPLGGLILVQNALVFGAILAFARACFRARRPALASLLLAGLLVASSSVALVRGQDAGGFGQGFRRTFVEEPIQNLDRAAAKLGPGAALLKGLREVVVRADESRSTWAACIGIPAAIDLAFGGLGALAFALRWRPRGGSRA